MSYSQEEKRKEEHIIHCKGYSVLMKFPLEEVKKSKLRDVLTNKS